MKILALAGALILALLPTIASAHTLTNEDMWAIHAMGYRSWAVAHNQAAPNDPVGPCIDPAFRYDAGPEWNGVNRCTAAEIAYAAYQAQVQAAQQAAYIQAVEAAWQVQAAQAARYRGTTTNCSTYDNGDSYTCTSY